MIKAILLMGGAGTRFRSEVPKQFHRLSGKKIYLHTLERFLETNLFDEILLVCHREWIEEVQKDLERYPKNIRVIRGGDTRQESSYLGLIGCGKGTRFVVIHDAVRPFVSREILQNNVKKVEQFKAVDTCIPSADTLVLAPKGEEIQSIPKRSDYLRGQTPQSFAYEIILKAHEHFQGGNNSDDCSLVLREGHRVYVVAGSEENIKITNELDLTLAEQLFRLEQKMIGAGTISLRGKKIAITGGTGGIGQALFIQLQQEGAIPFSIARSSVDFPCDITDFSQVKQTFARLGEIDALINCAGLFKHKFFEEFSQEEMEEFIAVNLMGPIYSCRCAEIKAGGNIVNVASSSYSRGRKGFSLYGSAKAALVNFTQSLAEENPHLRINAIAPARTATKMRKQAFPDEDSKTLLAPETVAETILNLLQQPAMTGVVIEVSTIR